MANRTFFKDTGSLQRGMVTLYGTVNIGATGAPTLVEGAGKTGFTISRTGAGAYTITLADVYAAIMDVDVKIQAGTPAATDGLSAFVTAATASTRVITLVCKTNNGSFTTADPPNPSVMRIVIAVKNSSV